MDTDARRAPATDRTSRHAPHPPGGDRGSSSTVAVQIGAAASLLGSLAFISTVLGKEGLTPRESFLLPLGVAGCVIASVGLALLVGVVPALLSAFPGWVRAVVSATLAFTLASAWFNATAVIGIATHTSDPVFDEIGASAALVAFMAPKALLGLVAFGALAMLGLRRRLLRRHVAAVFALAAVASLLPPFPPALVLASVGLLLMGRRRRTTG
jgi:hypothetical protein